MRRRAAKPSMVFQLNQMAGKSKITPAIRRRSNECDCLPGDGFVGVPTLSKILITSIRPVPTLEEFNRDSPDLQLASGRGIRTFPPPYDYRLNYETGHLNWCKKRNISSC